MTLSHPHRLSSINLFWLDQFCLIFWLNLWEVSQRCHFTTLKWHCQVSSNDIPFFFCARWNLIFWSSWWEVSLSCHFCDIFMTLFWYCVDNFPTIRWIFQNCVIFMTFFWHFSDNLLNFSKGRHFSVIFLTLFWHYMAIFWTICWIFLNNVLIIWIQQFSWHFSDTFLTTYWRLKIDVLFMTQKWHWMNELTNFLKQVDLTGDFRLCAGNWRRDGGRVTMAAGTTSVIESSITSVKVCRNASSRTPARRRL